MTKVKLVFFIGILLSIIIRSFFILNGSEIADVHSLHEMGQFILDRANPYLALNYNVYPPLALDIEAFSIFLSDHFHQQFFVISKIWPNLADILTGILIYFFLIKNKTKSSTSIFWSTAYILNPLQIIISAGHGQIDSIVSFFIVCSIYFLTGKLNLKKLIISGLSLGLAISIKPNPLLLLPAILLFIYYRTNLKTAFLFLLLAILPVTILLWPYVNDFPIPVLNKIFGYSGSKDLGVPALVRGYKYLSGEKLYQINLAAVQISKWLFLFLYTFLIIFYRKSKKLVNLCLLIYLLFVLVYFGISVQYLSWVLPLAAMVKEKFLLPFSIFGSIAIVGFYFYVNPAILLIQLNNVPAFQSWSMLVYSIGNIFLLAVLFLWTYKSFKSLQKIS